MSQKHVKDVYAEHDPGPDPGKFWKGGRKCGAATPARPEAETGECEEGVSPLAEKTFKIYNSLGAISKHFSRHIVV